MTIDLNPEILLKAYSVGLFPMAESVEDEEIFWCDPDPRGIIPLDTFHVPSKLRKFIRKFPYNVTVNKDFSAVIRACAGENGARRPGSWINSVIIDAYERLHDIGHAHSIEVWDEGELVGGLYGVSLGGGFFGESMFSTRTDTSKAALVCLVAILKYKGYQLLDTQFMTDHLRQFGGQEIQRDDYKRLLSKAITKNCEFYSADDSVSLFSVVTAFLQSNTQMS